METLQERLSALAMQMGELREQLVLVERQRFQLQAHLLRLEGAMTLLEELLAPAPPDHDSSTLSRGVHPSAS